MKRHVMLTLSIIVFLVSTSVATAAGIGDSASKLGKMLGNDTENTTGGASQQSSALVGALTGQLGVDRQQAAGGAGALLGLAKNQLDSGRFSQLTSKVPGLSGLMGGGSGMSGSMLGNLSSLSKAQSVFSSLGMSPDMIGQFAPVMLGYLGNQGVGSGLLDQLGGIWGQ